jgi:hypothetical protein
MLGCAGLKMLAESFLTPLIVDVLEPRRAGKVTYLE